MQNDTVRLGIYQHYKGKNYEVLGEVIHSETMEKLVLYKALYGEFGLWVRPKAMFLETVVVDGQEKARFAYIGQNKNQPN